ncbi:MAG: trigger factor [Acidimicrobiia bacterium]|nr:trigger factor [Acidimicrobiia bacterium]
METTVEALDGNKVRLHVAVPAAEFEKAIDAAFRKLAGEVKIPGFRPGKAPRRLLEARFGAEAARVQALQDALPDYYGAAVTENDVDVIAPPEIEITAGQESGDVEFDAVVEVRPVVRLVGYDSLRVELPWAPVDDEAVDSQIDSLRERFSELVDSEAPLTDGDFATIDIHGSIDGEEVEGLVATEFLYRVGSGIVVPGLDAQIRGTRPGAILEFAEELPERFAERAGQAVTFRVLVKDAKQRRLPDLTDEWVAESSELETVEEMRADVTRRLDVVSRVQAQMALRERVLEAVADLVPIEAPEALVRQETERRLHDLLHRLADQEMTIDQYLAASGRQEQDLINEVQSGAGRAVLADLALRAVVAQEEIEATDADLDAEVFKLAERMQEKPDRVRRDLEKRGSWRRYALISPEERPWSS